MATMIASGSNQLSSPLPVQDKGQRNKRKFRTESHSSDSSKLIPPRMEYPNFDFPTEKPANDFNIQRHVGVCDLCTGLTCPTVDELQFEDYLDADWTETTEAQLEELVLKNMDMVFKGAILKIVSNGHAEEAATKAVLRSGICYGSNDTLTNVVDNALAFLAKGKDIDSSKEHLFEDLQQLAKYVLAEMVCALREVRPFFSTGDAMWCLLICDMNVSLACAMDCDPLNGLYSDERVCPPSLSQAKQEPSINTSASTTISGLSPKSKQLHSMRHFSQISPQIQMPHVAGIPNLPSVRSSSSSNNCAIQNNHHLAKQIPLSSCNGFVDAFSCSAKSQTNTPEERTVNNKMVNGICAKRESILLQNPVHLEKNLHAYKSNGALRTGKMSNLGSLDKKCKSSLDSTSIHLKSASMKKDKSGVEAFLGGSSPSLSFSAGGPANLPFSSKNVNPALALPTANTELSLSIPSKSSMSSSNNSDGTNSKSNIDVTDYRNCSGAQSDNMGVQLVPSDKKDNVMINLVHRVRELQIQLNEWSEWAQQKVMQAARRLSKEKAELQTLRHEKEEASRVRKEKQSVEESTIKKLTEMESALSKASSQVEKANAASRSLEAENAWLRLEMETAKLHAAESAANCLEVSKREMETMKNARSWEREKTILREELMEERRKSVLLQQEVEQAKGCLIQLEGRWKHEEKVKDQFLKQASSVRKQREQIDASAKLKEDAVIYEAEKDMQRYKDDVRKLESQVEKLRINTLFPKASSLTWGLDGKVPVSCRTLCTPGMVDPQEIGYEDVARDRECVMCLTEEMSVVFLPCAHQVVCNTCNELHEKQGMKDCPSCRTRIQRRISVRHSGSKP